jgi:molybdopterin/thiamine biosynthesis adenylyltransferase/rhodanese-related sulfurtransferase
MFREQNLPELSSGETSRYSRHIILPEVGSVGQRRLKAAKVLIIGAGGLGSPAAIYLAAAGVGTIGIVDFDNVDLSNLQRQILHTVDEVGKPKLESAKRRLAGVNPEVNVVLHAHRLDASNALELITQYDVVVDGTDNFSTRYLVNDACVFAEKPLVYGSIYRFEGQATVFYPYEGPCYRCLFPDPPPPEAVPNCAEGGVLGVLAGLIGTLQATEAIKLILSLGNTLQGRLLLYDALEMRFDTLNVKRNPQCPICGSNPTITELKETAVQCGVGVVEVNTGELVERLRKDNLRLLDVRNPEEYAICKIEGSTLIPLNELPERLEELDQSAETIVYCKSGMRSKKAAELLSERGFKNVKSLQGGILAWIREQDPSMQAY